MGVLFIIKPLNAPLNSSYVRYVTIRSARIDVRVSCLIRCLKFTGTRIYGWNVHRILRLSLHHTWLHHCKKYVHRLVNWSYWALMRRSQLYIVPVYVVQCRYWFSQPIQYRYDRPILKNIVDIWVVIDHKFRIRLFSWKQYSLFEIWNHKCVTDVHSLNNK